MDATPRRHLLTRTLCLCAGISALLLAGGCAGSTASSKIKPEGGKVRVDGYATVTAPAGTFAQPTEVTIERRRLSSSRQDLGAAKVLFDIERPAAEELRVTVNAPRQPLQPLDVEFAVPRPMRQAAAKDDRFPEDRPVLRVFARNHWRQPGGREQVSLEPLTGWFDPKSNKVRVTVPPHVFARTADNMNATVATLRLAAAHLSPAPIPAAPHPGGSPLTPVAYAPAGASDECALRMAPPLRGEYRVVTPFGMAGSGEARQFHTGIDFAPAGAGDGGADVLAMAGGVVRAAGVQQGDDGRPTGWNGFVILGHGPDGAGPYTVYANLDPASIRVAPRRDVRRGDVLGTLAAGDDAREPVLHVEYVPQSSTNRGVKADPTACFGTIFAERVTAGFRSSALIRIPAQDADHQSIDESGNDADRVWWSTRTNARTRTVTEGRTLTYSATAGGEVETVADERGLRAHFGVDARPRIESGRKEVSQPDEATAAASGGGRLRFRTLGPARYRVTVRYNAPDAADWGIEHRFQRMTGGKSPQDVNKDFTALASDGNAAAKLERTFEGRLDQPGSYEFDFLPAVAIGGGADKSATLTASALLEVTPDAR